MRIIWEINCYACVLIIVNQSVDKCYEHQCHPNFVTKYRYGEGQVYKNNSSETFERTFNWSSFSKVLYLEFTLTLEAFFVHPCFLTMFCPKSSWKSRFQDPWKNSSWLQRLLELFQILFEVCWIRSCCHPSHGILSH